MVDTVVSRSQAVTTPINTTTGQLSAVNSTRNRFLGTVTLTADTPVTVANTNVTANSIVTFTLKTANSPGTYPAIQTITPGTGFTVEGSSGDTSVYNYSIEG